MMGSDHGWTGAVAFAALAPQMPATGAVLALGVAATAGAAVLPDIDHPDSTVSRTFGFLTGAFAWVVEKISGGHRHGTHSIIGVAVMTGLAWEAARLQGSVPRAGGHPVPAWQLAPAGLLLALLFSAAIRALLGQVFIRHLRLARFAGHHADAAGIAAAAAAIWSGADLAAFTSWHVPLLALATAAGCAAHIAGDMLTHGGCPLLYPLSRHEFGLLPEPVRITTNKWAEHWIVSPCLLTAFAWLAWRDSGAAAALHHGTPAALLPAARQH